MSESDQKTEIDAVNARYHGVIDGAVDGVIIIDEFGIVDTFNPAAQRIFGYAESAVVGRNVSMLMPEPDRSQHDGYLRHYTSGGAPQIIGIGREVQGRRSNGELFPMELAVGEVVGMTPRRFVGTVRDISGRRALEQALAEREQQMALLIDHAPIGIFSAKISGNFVRVNPALCNLLGYPEAAFSSLNCEHLTAPEDRALMHASLAALLAGGKSECHCLVRWVRADGAIIHVALHAVLAANGPGTVIGQVLDMTDQVRAARESAEARERLAQVGRVTTLGEMVSAIAHEINQPLTAISAYAQACRRLLEGSGAQRVVVDSLESIASQALRAGDIVRRIRGFVRHHESERESSDMNAIVARVLEFADFDLRDNEVALSTDFAPDLPPVLVDPVQIQQVCLNLVRNAVDAMQDLPPAQRRLALSTARCGTGVVFECADNGPGVSAEIRERLFEPFQTTKAEGMGMGLSISRSIVTAHEGVLRYADGADGGAVFRVELPANLDS